jgi:uncharacterized ferritin-like protein (DUF455 family)
MPFVHLFSRDYPVHEGLWESATETNGSLLARLAVVHMVHEARGLDVAPKRLAQVLLRCGRG